MFEEAKEIEGYLYKDACLNGERRLGIYGIVSNTYLIGMGLFDPMICL